jgi:hypothetical protein
VVASNNGHGVSTSLVGRLRARVEQAWRAPPYGFASLRDETSVGGDGAPTGGIAPWIARGILRSDPTAASDVRELVQRLDKIRRLFPEHSIDLEPTFLEPLAREVRGELGPERGRFHEDRSGEDSNDDDVGGPGCREVAR